MSYEETLKASLKESMLNQNKVRTKVIRDILVELRAHEKRFRTLQPDFGPDIKKFESMINKLIKESVEEREFYLQQNGKVDHNVDREEELAILSEFTSSPPQELKSIQVSSSGTCFIINDEGIVLTNAHVVGNNKEMKVTLKGEDYKAKLIATDYANDLAILKTDLTNMKHFCFALKDSPRLDEITALGFGFGKSFSSDVKATRGIVSSLAGIANNYSQFQIDASIQVGNSGGPILNKNSCIVGVAVAKLDTEAAYKESGTIAENVNFAIKISTVKQFLDSNDINYDLETNANDEININKVIDTSVLYIYS